MPTPMQQMVIDELKVQSVINADDEIRVRVDFLKKFLRESNASGFVLGISGGQDSSLAGKLAQMAVTELREEETSDITFVAVLLPYGKQQDEADVGTALDFINPDELRNINIKDTVDAFKSTWDDISVRSANYSHKDNPLSDYAKGNVKARVRMMTQYAFASERNLLVVGTDHAAESVVGFFTKFGDGSADLIPLAGLNKRQGRELLKALDTPARLYEKVPTADLLDDKPCQSDEDELGITYEVINDFLEGKTVSADDEYLIMGKFFASGHKRRMPYTPFD